MLPALLALLPSLLGSAGGAAGGATAGISNIAGSVPDMVKLIAAMRQGSMARKLSRTPRPAAEIPGAATQGLNTAYANYLDNRVPGQDYIAGQISGSTAQLIKSAKEAGRTPAEILQAAAAGNTNQNDALMQLSMQGANMQQQDASQLYGQLQNMAGYQEKKWQWDKQTPYVANMNAAGALRNASGLNLMNGVKGLASTYLASTGKTPGQTGLTADAYSQILQKYNLGGNNSQSPYVPMGQKSTMNPDRTLNMPDSWNMKQLLWDMQAGRGINNPGL